jgi:hypothetical protein
MTHDCLRDGITTLFASLNVLDGTVLGRCMQSHRHQQFVRSLNAIEAAVPADKVIHVVLDNYCSQKHPEVLRWPRWIFHVRSTSGSRLDAVESLFSEPTRGRLKRGVFHSWSTCGPRSPATSPSTTPPPKPCVWTKPPAQILAELSPLNAPVH